MRFFGKNREHRELLAPDGTLGVAETRPAPRVVRREAPRRSRPLAWLLALGIGAAVAVVAVVSLQDPRTVGTQLDDAVARVKDAGNQAGQTVANSQNAAADASRNALDGVATAIDDAGITAKVKAALAVDPALSAARIDVETSGGIVRLAGPAPDAAAKDRATVLASAPQGVRGVDNRLSLPQAGNVVAVAAPAAQQPAQPVQQAPR